jgi:signal transduction histidine kinase
MNLRPRLTVRARLTVLYTGLFAAGGAIIVVVGYVLVAQLGVPGESQPLSPTVLQNFAAQCQAGQRGNRLNKPLIAQCTNYLEQQGAQNQRNLTLSHLLEYSLITLIAVIALAAVLGWIFSGRALRPLHRITAAARGASQHNLSARVALTGPHDELRQLAETFDEMLDRLEGAFEGERRFIANASHELRTPLAVMRTTIDVVLDDPDASSGDLRAMGTDVRAAVDHAEQLIAAMLILARNERGLALRDQFDLATIAEDVLDTAHVGDLRVHTSLEPAVISGDPVLAERLVANLVDNAVRYNVADGDVWIDTAITPDGGELTVTNTGPLISDADVDRITKPFQRLDDRTAHEGFGLGLTIVLSIASIHGGTVLLSPHHGGGLTVTVTIPTAVTTATVPSAAPNERSSDF